VRAAIYALAVSVFGTIGVYGAVDEKQTAAWLILVQAGIALMAALLTPWGTGGLVAIIRGSLYSVTAGVFAVLGVYAYASDEQLTSWLSICSALVAVLSFVNVNGLAPKEVVSGQ